MKLTHVLLGEHAVLYSLFDHIERQLAAGADLAALQAIGGALAEALVSHAKLEDELLFPALASTPAAEGPVSVMREEHGDIDELCADLPRADDADDAAALLGEIIEMSRAHFAKEEHMLFPLVEQLADATELECLTENWARLRGVTLG